jgi:two-component system KDP operon response regulator KdpE
VRLGGNPISLTAAEYKLLFHLVRSAGRLVTHQALIERIWGSEWGASANSLKALVSRLRLKLEPDSSSFHYIRNERGLGYRFVRPTGGRNGSSAPSAPPDLSPIRSGA